MAQSMTIEDRIAHFLRLAEDDGATQAERDTAATQAERLMVKHGIERAAALAADHNTDEKVTTDHIFFGGLYADARITATSQVVAALGLKAYTMAMRGVDGANSHAGRVVAGFRLTVVGFENDLVDAMRLIRSLDVQSAVAMKNWAKTRKDAWYFYSAAEKTKAKRSFVMAFGVGAATRLRDTRKAVIDESEPGTALVLVDRAKQVADYYRTIPNLRAARSARRVTAEGLAAGKAAGYSANTGSGPAIGQRYSISR